MLLRNALVKGKTAVGQGRWEGEREMQRRKQGCVAERNVAAGTAACPAEVRKAVRAQSQSTGGLMTPVASGHCIFMIIVVSYYLCGTISQCNMLQRNISKRQVPSLKSFQSNLQ